MQEVFPLELKQKFKAKIIKLQQYLKYNHKTFFQCSTNFGQMTLLIQQLQKDSQQLKHSSISPYEFFKCRNSLLFNQKVKKYVPVIYQQYILKSHKDKSTCFTLMEPIEIVNFQQVLNKAQSKIHSPQIGNISQSNLIFFADQINKLSSFQLQLPFQIFQLKKLMSSKIVQKLYFDFTCLKKTSKIKNIQDSQNIQQSLMKKNLNTYLNFFENKKQCIDKISQVIFLRDKIFKFSYKKLLQLPIENWTALSFILNIFEDISIQFKQQAKSVQEQQNSKFKISQLKKLNGKNIQILYQNYSYKNLDFLDGICINALQEIVYEDLVKNFFIKASISPAFYTITKQTFVMVFASKSIQFNQKEDKTVLTEENQATDILIVTPQVNKLECINFFITYFKYIDPLIQSISFVKEENLLQFQFLNKSKKKRKIKIKFYQQYVVKDEEISMIIQKSRLDGAALNLSKMAITDSFLLFLANSDKMKKIKRLDISYCPRITQNGVNSLLVSPFCKNLEIVNVSGAQIMDSSIESLALKANLSQLYINNCKRYDQNNNTKISFKSQNLQRLQAIGLNIQISLVDSLQYLKLTEQLPLESLRIFKNLFLKELTIKLIDNKKNIMDIFGNFYAKQVNPIRAFVQGNSASTLKYLDISNSNVKIKNLKSMFHMPELQTLKLNNIHKIQEIDFPISSKILTLQVENCPIRLKDLGIMLKNTKIMSKISINHTQIGKFEIIDYIVQNMKFINTICLSEEQYTNKLIQKDKPILKYIEAIQVKIDRLINPQMDSMLNQMLYKISKSNKVVRLIADSKSEPILIKKVKKYLLTVNGLPLKNLYINSKSQKKIINTKFSQQIQEQQHVVIHKSFTKPIKVQLYDQKQNFGFSIPQKNTLFSQNKNEKELSFMTNFTYLYKKIVRQHPDDIYQVSLKGNKTINSSIIKMLLQYSTEQKIKSIDFTNCVFKFMDVAQYLIDIPFLNQVNNGSYQLIFQSETFLQMSQKYLKFFMRIKEIRKFKIIANQITEADILFSILYHIIDQHCQSLKYLDIQLNGIKIPQESVNFWIRIFTLKSLKKLALNLNQCQNYQILKQNLKPLQQINMNKLKSLRFFNFPIQYLPPIKCNILQEFQVNLQNSLITQLNLINLVKPFVFHLKTLQLNCSCCDLIVNLNKLSSLFKLASNLQKLVLSYQYCPLKESSLFEFIQDLAVLKKLQYFELDISYTITMLNQLVRSVSNLHQNINKSYFKIYAINQISKDFVFHKEELDSQGIEIIT